MKRFFLLLALLLTGAPAWAQVIGNIDGMTLSGTQYRINGWACDTGVTASIDVHVYVGGAAGTGTGIAIVTASNASEATVATRCGTSGTAYRFSIPLSDSLRTQHSNKKIYIHGISKTGGSNLAINNSGVFLIPPPLSQTRSFVYNAAQELCKTIEPETGATVMHYDGAGNLDWSAAGLNLTSTTSCQDTDASIAARKVTRTYDARNRLKTLNFPDNAGNQTWTYTPDGLPASIAVVNPNVANPTLTSYAYNLRRLLTGESLNHLGGSTVWGAGYGYDANGALKIQTYPSGLSIDYAPNALGQPTQAGTYATSVSYYPNGAIAQFTYGNGIKHTLAQNLRQLPDRSLDDYGTSKFLDDSYDYDQNGNVAAISDGLTGNRGNRTMTYDELDRLTKVDSPMYGTDAANHVALYGYDGLDNLTGVVIGGTKARLLTYCYDANWRLANVKNNFNGEGCAGSTVIGLGYDVQGNLANKNGQAFEFDYGNRLRNVPGKEWYAYDGQGRRVLSCTSAACSYQMYSQVGQLLTSYDYRNNKRVESIYLGGSLVALRELDTTTSTTTTKYQHTDALGSPVAETNPSRAILEKSEYEPFGQVLNRPLEDGPGYTGHTLDASTGLNYMQQRYYDPNIGRFLSVDPVSVDTETGDNFCRYCYVSNNPYTFVDSDGRAKAAVWLVKLVQGGVQKIARISKEQAVLARRAELNIQSNRRQLSHQIENAAYPGKARRDVAHELKDGSGKKGLPHYQTDKKRGHSFWGALSVVAATTAAGLNEVAEAADYIPEPTPHPATPEETAKMNKLMGIISEKTGVPMVGTKIGSDGGFQGYFRVEGRLDAEKLNEELKANH